MTTLIYLINNCVERENRKKKEGKKSVMDEQFEVGKMAPLSYTASSSASVTPLAVSSYPFLFLESHYLVLESQKISGVFFFLREN